MKADEKEAYDAEMGRAGDSDDSTPEQRKAIRVADMSLGFESERAEAVSARRAAGIDDRLITSYQLYEGQRDSKGRETFDSDVVAPTSGSRAYANIVRQIANDGAAQIGDLLFPNDDRNYGLKPVTLSRPPLAIADEPAVDSKGEPIVDAEGQPLTNAQAHTRRVERAKKKTVRMFTKVDAALIKARYPSKARGTIQAGAVYGTGVLKGPIPTADQKGRWAKTKGGKYALNRSGALHPDAKNVNPMDFYPDMTATCIEECRYTWEKMPTQPSELERGVRELSYSRAAVNRLLGSGTVDENQDQLDTVDEARPQATHLGRAEGRFILWERHGDMSRDQLETLDVTDIPKGSQYHNAVLTMCNGHILKAVVVPYASSEPLYSVYCWDEDPLNIFGYGIPWLMQDQQRSYVSGWRMALDNGGLSAAPQVIIDRQMVEPVDGKWEMRGGKEWYAKQNTYSVEQNREPFRVINITQNLEQLFVMMDRSIADAYVITGVTRVDNAQQGLDNAPVTLGATQILQNNTSVSRRAQARRWDDKITLGLVTRFYDYFMQFEDDDDIKANMEVEPRGATVLLAKELTATNTIQLYQMTMNGSAEGSKGVNILRGIESAMQIPSGSYIETEEETEARQQQESEAGDQIDPMLALETRKVEVEEAKVELAFMDKQLDQMVAGQTFELNQARLSLEEATAMAHLDDKAQSRIDQYHINMEEMAERHQAELSKFNMENQTKRDLVAAKLNADGGLKGREQAMKEREIANEERELTHKITTGESGI